MLGPIFFILYTKPLSDLIQCHSIESQSFADDAQLQFSVPPSNVQSAISSLETCLSDIKTWILENKLKLNNDKTEALLLRSSSKSFSVGKPSLSVAVKYLFLLLPEILVFTSDMT